jgi:hypothetical protein
MRGLGFTELIVFIGCFTIVFLIPALYFRYRKQMLVHAERMAALDKGVPLPAQPNEPGPWTPRVYLLRGLIWLLGGLGLIVFLLGLALTTNESIPLSQKLWESHRLREAGATEDQIKQMINSNEMRRHVPEGVSLIGLIPVGVGLAYLIFYIAESKQR